MMDFGATVCTPQSPHCADCPLADTCVALSRHTVATLPVKHRKTTVKERRLVYIYIRYKGQTALRRRGKGDIWQGLWEPLLVFDSRQTPADSQPPVTPLPSDDCLLVRQNVRHVLTHRILTADFYLWTPAERPLLPDGYKWTDEADIDAYALPRLVEILFNALPPSPLP
jgi:A/G-specific adenine glycosylase